MHKCNLTEEGKRGKELTKSVYSGRIERWKETNSTGDALFTMEEIKRAIAKTAGKTSPGKDEI